MKSITFKSGVILCIVVLLAGTINAQNRRPRNQPRSNQPPVNPVPTINIPIIADTLPEIDSVPQSIRPPGTFDPKSQGERKPLPYEDLRWDDALYVQKVWRELDLREKMNQPFLYDAVDNNGSQLFINILLKAVKNGTVPAFADDRFSIPVASSRLTELTQGKLDTIPKYNLTTMDIDTFVVIRSSFDPKTVTRLRIMEEWIFDREGSRMHTRIIGIAALKARYFPGNKEKEAHSLLFWVNYADLRPILANRYIYNPKNMGQSRMTWEELFESRMFSSYILKSTLDNASNKSIRQYIKDPKLALLEGDNIKDKIFNYEQDLWSY